MLELELLYYARIIKNKFEVKEMLCLGVLAIEFLSLSFLVSTGVKEPSEMLASVLIVLFSFSYALYIMTTRKYKGVWKYMLAGYFFRVALLFWDLYFRKIYVLPDSGIDSEGHWGASLRYARGFDIGRAARKPFGIAIRYLGEQRLFIQFFMVLSAIITFIVVLKILRELEIPEKVVNISMFLIAMLPLYSIHSSIFLMEAYPVMFSAVALLFFVRWYRGQGEKNFLYTMIAALLAAFFHTGIITAAAGYVLVRLIYDPRTSKFHFSWKSLALGLIAVALFIFIFINFASLFSDKLGGIKSYEDIDSGVNWDNVAKSGYSRYVGNSSSISNIIIYTPIRIIFFLFCPLPLPFMMRGLQDVIAMVFGSFFYMYTYYRAILYIKHRGKFANLAKCILIVGLITAFVFGWGRADMGTNSRHRDKLVAVYIVLLAISMTDNKKSVKHKRYRLSYQ